MPACCLRSTGAANRGYALTSAQTALHRGKGRYQPDKTIGQASEWTNMMSLAFLSGANRGTVDHPDQAKRQVADELFASQIYQPWVALEFGGLSHCVDSDRSDHDGFPRPVGPHDPTRDVCRDHLHQGRDGHGGYAQRFLRFPVGSQERDAEYEAIKNGVKPLGDRQFAGYEVDKTDAPAVDIQQAGAPSNASPSPSSSSPARWG